MSDHDSPSSRSAQDTAQSSKKKRRLSGAARYAKRREKLGLVRHQSRVLAMQGLFERDLTQHDLDDILARMDEIDDPDEETTTVIPPVVSAYARHLAMGVTANIAEIDPKIAAAAPAFPLDQIAGIDRNVLRIAVFEMLFQEDIPRPAAINEAVEIAKHYGGPSSGKFVNGVLGTIVRALPERTATPSTPTSPAGEPNEAEATTTDDITEAWVAADEAVAEDDALTNETVTADVPPADDITEAWVAADEAIAERESLTDETAETDVTPATDDITEAWVAADEAIAERESLTSETADTDATPADDDITEAWGAADESIAERESLTDETVAPDVSPADDITEAWVAADEAVAASETAEAEREGEAPAASPDPADDTTNA